MIQLNNKANCFGCTSCASICPHDAIKMQPDSMGFLYPVVNEDKCVNCGLCEKTCPLSDLSKSLKGKTKWAYCLYNNDLKILLESSSGGLFWELSKYIIENGGVVYGVVYDKDWFVRHERATEFSKLQKFRGSKYVQSSLGDTFKSVEVDLKNDKLVLFSGTPCQIAGLKKFLRKDFEKLYTCDLLCHGVPSPSVYKDYISFVKKKRKSEIVNINMKDKTESWGNQSLRIYYVNNTSEQGTSLTYLWNRVFFSNLTLRPSCYVCNFVDYDRCSDFTIGDYWNIKKYHPDFYNHNGVSLILIQTYKGFELFNAIKENFKYRQIKRGEYPQDSLEVPVAVPPLRDCFWEDLSNKGFTFVARKYFGYEDRTWKLFIRKMKMKFNR